MVIDDVEFISAINAPEYPYNQYVAANQFTAYNPTAILKIGGYTDMSGPYVDDISVDGLVASTAAPTSVPTAVPSYVSTGQPTSVPSGQPTSVPSNIPTGQPTLVPSGQPTSVPSNIPTDQPTSYPTIQPTNSTASSAGGDNVEFQAF